MSEGNCGKYYKDEKMLPEWKNSTRLEHIKIQMPRPQVEI